MSILRFFQRRRGRSISKPASASSALSQNMDENIEFITGHFGNSFDLVVQKFQLKTDETKIAVIYIKSLTDRDKITDKLLASALAFIDCRGKDTEGNTPSASSFYQFFSLRSLEKAIERLLDGNVIVFVEGCKIAVSCPLKKVEFRKVDMPISENLIRGPKVGLTENVEVNISLIRDRIRNPELRFRKVRLGSQTRTIVVLAYIEGLAETDMVNSIVSKVSSVKIDGVLDSSAIEQLMEGNVGSFAPQALDTERLDKAVAAILSGKVVVLSDGSPVALIYPTILSEFFHSPEDYYFRWWYGSGVRVLRVIAIIYAVLVPGLFIAFVNYHPEMLPYNLIVTISQTRFALPLPLPVELLLVLISFEMIRESSVRMPKPIGPTLGIVAGFIIGDAAVRAGIIGPLTTVIVASAAVGSYASPNYSMTLTMSLLKFLFVMLASVAGLFGVIVGAVMILIHLASLENFGVPYLTPVAPSYIKGLKDIILRAPIQSLRDKKPEYLKYEEGDKNSED